MKNSTHLRSALISVLLALGSGSAFFHFLPSNASATNEAKPFTYIGFLEAEGPRRVFVLRDGTWQSALPDAESVEALNQERNSILLPEKWTVFHDGKVRGQISAEPVAKVTLFKDLGLQKLVGKKPPLPKQKKEPQFDAFDGPRVRPLLLTSEITIADPDGWKPDQAKKIPAAAKIGFKKLFGAQANYDGEAKGNSDGDSGKKYELKDTDIVLSKSYKTTTGSLEARIIALKLQLAKGAGVSCETEGDNCQGIPLYWFYIPNGQEPIFLAKASALVETADVNSDGVSDFAFWISEYNLGGYSLVDGKTRTLTQAHWSYH